MASATIQKSCRALACIAVLIFSRATILYADIFTSDETNNRILRYDEQTGALIGVFAESSSGLNRPVGLAFGKDGDLYVANNGGNGILRYNGKSGAYIDAFVPTGDYSPIQFPYDLVFGPNGNLFVSAKNLNDDTHYHIYELNKSSGAIVHRFESGANLVTPFDLEFGANGNLFVVDRWTKTLMEFDGTSGTFVRDFTSQQVNVYPWGFTFGSNGDAYVINYFGDALSRLDGQTGAIISNFVPNLNHDGPDSIQLGPDGNLYVYEFNSKKLDQFDEVTGQLLGSFNISAASAFVFSPRTVSEPASFAIALPAILGLLAYRSRKRGRYRRLRCGRGKGAFDFC
jgi:DNA-binding beta-propeller fold protein YncE